jgi:hypothetical protein
MGGTPPKPTATALTLIIALLAAPPALRVPPVRRLRGKARVVAKTGANPTGIPLHSGICGGEGQVIVHGKAQ